MPYGEFNLSANGKRWSATPVPRESRSRVMRLALGVIEPARFMNRFCTQPRTPLASAGFGGAFVSATSTSPLGNTYSQRGCARPVANAVTVSPAAGTGWPPGGQPFAGATYKVGSSDFSGGGICGFGPIPASSGRRAVPPQAPSTTQLIANTARRDAVDMEPATASKMPRSGNAWVRHNYLLVSSTSVPQ